MAVKAKQVASRRFPALAVEHATPGQQQMERERTNIIPNYRRDIARIGAFAANTTGFVDLPVGAYTYRGLYISVIAPAEIVGKTTLRAGKHYVNTANIPEYLGMISLDLNARAFVELTADEIIRLADYNNIQNTNGLISWAFGGPGLFETDVVQDAFGLGTQGVNSLRIRMAASAAWVNGMTVEVVCEYYPIVRPVGWFVATSRQVIQVAQAGNVTLPDLAYGLNWSAMWLKGSGIRSMKLEVDRKVLVDGDMWQISALHRAWGKDADALGNGLFYDVNRDKKGLAVDAAGDTIQERNRSAEVKADIYLEAAGEISVVFLHAGLFSELR